MRVRGVALLQLVKALRIHRPRTDQVLEERLRGYLDTRIVLTAWYPEQDHVLLLEGMSKLLPPGDEEAWRALGRQQAGSDLVENFAWIVVPGDPWKTLERVDEIWCLYYDSGRGVVKREGERRARIEVHSYEMAAHEGIGRLLAGYFDEMLCLAGASGADVRLAELGSAEKPIAWTAAWTAP